MIKNRKKSDLSPLLGNNSHSIMSAMLALVPVRLKFKTPCKIRNVIKNEIKVFGSHSDLTVDIWNSSYEKTLSLHRNFNKC